ncbi:MULTISPECIES: hypothetical protein [Thermus]|uniref:Uncharacterized protein n=1 Tax=Thermus brockianus TaxID=56956 RepID=A0A1J0LUW3_THEBO|nr:MULTISPECIES: hypothetical protein [Thermus]APD09245.1 hypothetical protein A0O31_01100 [Thermus brockianus]
MGGERGWAVRALGEVGRYGEVQAAVYRGLGALDPEGVVFPV